MLSDFKRSTESVGLEIHPNETKILSNQDVRRQKEATIDNIKVEVLRRSECAKYLGDTITFELQETTEIKNRLRTAWAAFHKFRQERTSRSYRSCHRTRLFNVVVTPTLTYASGTWTLTTEHERMIRSAQRKMLHLTDQTKRKYKQKAKKKSKEDEESSDWKKHIKNMEKKLKKEKHPIQILIKTVMFLS